MKKLIILSVVAVFLAGHAVGQNLNCNGLKNPVNFSLYNSPLTGQYTGKLGTKPSSQSNCSSGALGASFTTDVANSQLATVTSSQSASYCGQTLNNDTRFKIMHNTDGPGTGGNVGKDPLTNYALPYCPEGFNSSVRIGNCRISAEAEALYYTMTVNNNNKLVFINYAIVVQAPGHGVSGDPEFVIRVTKQNSNGQWVPISDTLCYVVSSTPTSNGGTVNIGSDGWHSIGTGYDQIYYRDWNQVVINLAKYYTQTIRIECMIADCSASGHYGYCYIAGDCARMNLDANGCAAGSSTEVATIAAPAGLANYRWYRSNSGVLSGAAREDRNNYSEIVGTAQDTLPIVLNNFIRNNSGIQDTMNQNTFMCEMTSYMDPTKPIISQLYTDVGNMKPSMKADSILQCDASITLYNKSYTPFDGNKDSNKVDSTITHWKFYSTPQPTPQSLVYEADGASVTYQYPAAGNYSAEIITYAYDTSCWNQKTIEFRTIKAPRPRIRFERNDLCAGDTITLYDETQGSAWHQWTIHQPTGDTTYVSAGSATRATFTETTAISLVTRTNTRFMVDTNADGVLDSRYCFAQIDTTINVGQYPQLTVHGDTIVCTGDQSDVWVESNVAGCQFDWYSVLHGSTPVAENNSHLITTISEDRTFYVKVTSPFGCESWDSVNLYLVQPSLNTTTDKICTGAPVTLWAGKAARYMWTASPDDPGLVGQETLDSIHVSPSETTTYTVTGYGSNGCSATALSQKISVYPYPIMGVQLTPDYIDSENPSVQFTDVSLNATSSLWNFGGGHTSTTRSVVYTFTDLSQDSLLISLTSYNPLGCSNDTSFYLPVGIFAVWFPNAFTPNLETNKTFRLFTANELTDFELYLYDRHGSLVWQTTNPTDEWDGTYNGHLCNSGSYVYICRYRRAGVERLMSQKGTVTLIR